MTETGVTGLILAGGKSTRFGKDKAGYVVAGQAMIAHVMDAVAAVVGTVMVSVGADAEAVPGLLCNARHVKDHYTAAGPLAGLHAGLRASETPWVLAVACDMPFVTPAVLRQLLEARTPEAGAVLARTPNGRIHPLCACYHTRTRSLAGAQLEAGERSLHAFLDLLDTVIYLDLPAGPLRNVNRPADLNAR